MEVVWHCSEELCIIVDMGKNLDWALGLIFLKIWTRLNPLLENETEDIHHVVEQSDLEFDSTEINSVEEDEQHFGTIQISVKDIDESLRSHEGPDAREKRPGLGRMDKGYTIDHVVESRKVITMFIAPDYP
ncbi:hypothetical protein AgCh_017250 [Apium graveolens]